jgi:hypothetical protein
MSAGDSTWVHVWRRTWVTRKDEGQDLPYGLTAQALIAIQKIKFKPAMKGGKPLSVRGNLELNFSLY